MYVADGSKRKEEHQIRNDANKMQIEAFVDATPIVPNVVDWPSCPHETIDVEETETDGEEGEGTTIDSVTDGEEADHAFAIFDKDSNGDINRDEMEMACMYVWLLFTWRSK